MPMARSFKKNNHRRIELLRQRQHYGLTEAEQAELEAVIAWCDQWMAARHPLPRLRLEEER